MNEIAEKQGKNREYQKKYRLKTVSISSKSGDNYQIPALRRLDLMIDWGVKGDLEQIAKKTGETQKAVIERLITAECERLGV